MRIDQVRAAAFGPFRGQSLDLAPGLTVVHGPNEAGKSSWFAATYAGLAGRRKQRGRGTQAQVQFAARHKPWSGSQWAAGVTVTLDDGTRLALEHNLAKGESRVVDVDTGRALGVPELESRLGRPMTTDGGLDGARILGLNRDAARATIFVAQADVLRVLQDAGELQQFLERVATTETADVTAEAALQWLEGLRRERVGVAHIGSKPLRATSEAARAAAAAAVAARDAQAQLVGLLTEQKRAEVEQRAVEARLAELERVAAWAAARELGAQLARARELVAASSDDGGSAVADDELVRRVTVALGALDERGERPALPEGPDAGALAEQLSTLPSAPEGDLEPSAVARAAHDAWVQAEAALRTHVESAPEPVEASPNPVDPDELRRLASVLERPVPGVDAVAEQRVQHARQAHAAALAAFEQAQVAHREQVEAQQRARADFDARWAAYQREQEQYVEQRAAHDAAVAAQAQARDAAAGRAFGTATMLLGAGGVVALVGVVLLVLGQVVPGAVVAALGVLLAVVGLVRRGGSAGVSTDGREGPAVGPAPVAPTPPEAVRVEPLDPPVRPELDPAVLETEAVLAAQRAQAEAVRGERQTAEVRLRELGLPAEPGRLRARARSQEEAVGAVVRLEHHRVTAAQLEGRRADAARALAQVLGRGDEVAAASAREELSAAWEEYVGACRARAQQATEAARRPGLEQAVAQRRELEDAHRRAVAEWERREHVVALLAREVAEGDDVLGDAAASLQGWLADQKQRRASSAQRRERGAALEQLLGGRTLEELEQEAEAATPEGPEPGTIPDDLDAQLERARELRERWLGRTSDLRGQQSQLSVPPVAGAIEDEAAAERAHRAVTELAAAIDVATAELERAKIRSHATVAPALEGSIRPWVPEVTRGRYLDVRINPADLTMKVTDHAGSVRDAHLLSHGTTEQLYLLLRIALAQHLASVDETAPLVLDDVTVQSDAGRTRAVLDLLHRVSQERQVVLFTQEDEVVAWAQESLGERDRVLPLVMAT